jgi:glycosyltransferase involved in cell wall biosynthesis
MMRVLHIQKVTGIGGCERHLLDLLPGLQARKIQIRAVALTSGDGMRFVDAARGRGVEVTQFAAGPDVNPWAVVQLVRRIRRWRPDLVHTHLIHADLYGAVAATVSGLPTVSSAHSTHSFFAHPLIRPVEAAAQRRAARVIAISRWVERFLAELKLARRDRIRVVPYGIDVETWAPRRGGRERARQMFGLGRHDIAIGATSRLIPGKGHDVLLRALADASREGPLRLLVAGDGPSRRTLERIAAELGLVDRVRFLGFIDDVRPLLHACDIFAFPTLDSLSEGFGLAALEAQAAAVPVVVSRTASLPEVVADGQTGVLVGPGSAEELALALVELARSPRRRRSMGAAGQKRARERFSLESMVEGTVSVYREVLGG